jgi:RNA 3'-terminal phosphate cyclase (GTP)
MVHIDGSHMQGGGQILRTALALSTLTGRPFRAEKIRHNRPAAGLKPQHLSAIQALIRMSGAKATGAAIGAGEIEFLPGNLKPGNYALNIGTAGSVTLLLQALLLPCMFADGDITLRLGGGTDTRWSIPSDYFTYLILPVFRRFSGIEVLGMHRGFYPRGQGALELKIRPEPRPSRITDGAALLAAVRRQSPGLQFSARRVLAGIQGVSAAAAVLEKARVAERQAEAATEALGSSLPVEIRSEYCRSVSPGSVITLWAVDRDGEALAGGDALGERGKPAEVVGREAAQKLRHTLSTEAVVDVHLADNLVPLLAMAGGQIRTGAITDHIRANMYVCERFLDVRFTVDEAAAWIGVER